MESFMRFSDQFSAMHGEGTNGRVRHAPWSLALCAACGCLSAGVASAGEVTLRPAADNTLYQQDVGLTSELSNGSGQSVFAGRTARGALRRALLRFDFSSIPAGSTITSVSLTMHCTITISADQTVRLHRMSNSWGEGPSIAPGEEGGGDDAETGDCSWNYRFFSQTQWTLPGGEYIAAPSASTIVGFDGFDYTWATTPELVADVQSWVDSPAANHGWIVIGNEADDASAKRFASRENANESQRPTLVVTFDEPVGCVTDYNQDGGGDTSDIIDLANDIAGGLQSFPGSNPDFNQDGGADTSDVIDLANVIAGGECP